MKAVLPMLAVAGGLLVSGNASAAEVTFNFMFDTYCDGMNLTVTNGTFVVGKSIGCFEGQVNEGFVSFVTRVLPGMKNRGPLLSVTSTNGGDGVALTYLIDVANRVWSNYYTVDGVTQSFNLKGTLTFVRPGAAPTPTTGLRNTADR